MKCSCTNSAAHLFAILLVTIAAVTSGRAASVTIQAESGNLGAEFTNGTSAGTSFISIASTSAGNSPGSSARVASYSVTVPEAGTYQLYARVRVGAGAFNDDSHFYANGFGSKSPTLNADWILVNGLAAVGHTASNAIVTNGGTAGTGVWKWLNLSLFAPGPVFSSLAGNLTQTFQIGGREDGLDIDKLVFGSAGYTFTVAELDAGGP